MKRTLDKIAGRPVAQLEEKNLNIGKKALSGIFAGVYNVAAKNVNTARANSQKTTKGKTSNPVARGAVFGATKALKVKKDTRKAVGKR